MPKPILISVVDDDESFRHSLRRLLKSYGYTVEVFPSAAAFLASDQLAATACLITDVHMPAMTGADLYQNLVAMGFAIPTILITAYPEDGVRQRTLSQGIACYLQKPLDDGALIDCIHRALARTRTPRVTP
ncbi:MULTISPECIES: response regulator transcription factor [unclassified Paraburkholderia]|uniref:response regulator transcription factor n=1 Tax=unclassified Paraburkholderia TaxID=2615204 RepID=UPI002AB7573F|nr:MULTISPECIES: response regulator [unclassified Paraburkholderia]